MFLLEARGFWSCSPCELEFNVATSTFFTFISGNYFPGAFLIHKSAISSFYSIFFCWCISIWLSDIHHNTQCTVYRCILSAVLVLLVTCGIHGVCERSLKICSYIEYRFLLHKATWYFGDCAPVNWEARGLWTLHYQTTMYDYSTIVIAR